MAAMAGGVSGREDPFPGPAAVPRARVKRFLRGSEEKAPRAAAPRLRRHLKNLGIRENSAAEKAARWEPLLPEEPGFLEPDPGQDSSRISQQEIQEAVDISSASKHFELRLEQFGPYRLDYTRTGRHLLLGGLRGHVAALDWDRRRLLSEFSTMEPLRDLCWLHSESLLAVAQQRWLHVYDSQGLELHVLRGCQGILRLQFLPFHFLLAAVGLELHVLRGCQGILRLQFLPFHFLLAALGLELHVLRGCQGILRLQFLPFHFLLAAVGLELHVLRGCQGILRLQFLPFHFLLAAVGLELHVLRGCQGILRLQFLPFHFLLAALGLELHVLRGCQGILRLQFLPFHFLLAALGLELHVLRGCQGILRLQFLPFHFLLAAVSSLGLLHFLDVSVGREVAALRTRSGRAGAMAQNPASALLHLGHSNGTVSVWSPAQAGPVLRLLAHKGGVRGVAVDGTGSLMATSGLDRRVRIFDLRNLGVLREWGLPLGASELHFSQRGLLGAATGDLLQIYPKFCLGDSGPPRPFLQHRTPNPPRGLQFCPFQDVLGAGHGLGFSSILVPGAGEPNFDALENNPYRSRRQRQEWEVKALLEKIPWELLTPDPDLLSRVDTAGLEQKHQERIQRLGFDPQAQPRFRPRRRRGRDAERRRRQVQGQRRRAEIRKILEQKEKNEEEPPRKRRKETGEKPQKIGKKNGEKTQKNQEKIGKKSKKIGKKLQKIGQQNEEKSPKHQEKIGEKSPKIGEKTPKIGKEIGEKPQKIGQKMGKKSQKNSAKIGKKSQKIGKKSQKIGKKNGEKTQKIGGKTPKIGKNLGGAPQGQGGALERFRK